jgi:acyl-CoA synthetase (AMP-forming)/AMP-acid ligase II
MTIACVHHYLERQAQSRPESILLIEGAARTTYAQIEAGANRVARFLLEQGIQRGDRIGLLGQNSRTYIESYYGILKAGAVSVALNAAADWSTHGKLMVHCQARGLLCGDRVGRRAAGIEHMPHLEFILGSRAQWPDLIRGRKQVRLLDRNEWLPQFGSEPPEVRCTQEDRAAIVYTSGSTGEPKGVILRHANLVANTESIVSYLGLHGRDRAFVVLPLHYVYGKSVLNTHVAVGGSVVLENNFLFPHKALDSLAASEATGLSGVPSTFAILLNRSNLAERPLAHLRYVTQAGGPMAAAMQERLIEALPGKQIFIMYGATEASARLSYLDPQDLPRKLGSIGKPIPRVELSVLREDGTEADTGEVGELVARGPNLMEGYWNDPVGTAEVLDARGYHTGDLARRDADGFFYVVGRKREMIKSGAHRIAPQEIESVLAAHPQVDEAAVVGQPDEMLGEAIHAFVSACPGQQLDSQEVLRWCRQRLPAYKMPKAIVLLKEFSRNGSGKIDKRALSIDSCAVH